MVDAIIPKFAVGEELRQSEPFDFEKMQPQQ